MAQQPLYLTDEAHIDARTVAVRWSHPAIASWLGATQHWKWGSEAFGTDGDAIVVVTNHIDEPCFCHVAIRQGHDVRVVKAVGLNDAMRAVGLDPNNFRVM